LIGESEIEIRDAAETFSLVGELEGMFRAFLYFKFKNKNKSPIFKSNSNHTRALVPAWLTK